MTKSAKSSVRACSCPRGHHGHHVHCLLTSDELRDQIVGGPQNGERCSCCRHGVHADSVI